MYVEKDSLSGEDCLEASVYGDNFSADIVGRRTCEKDDCAHKVTYITPLPVGAQRHAFADLVEDRRVHGADLIGDRAHEKSGSDAVAADAELARLCRK